MATLMPSRITTSAHEPLTSESIQSALRPWQRRILLQQVLYWFVGGLITGLILACLALIAARLFPWAGASYWALGVGVLCPVVALLAAIWYRPSLSGTAHDVDRRLGLHDRISTAWELRAETTTLPGLQRRDALKQLSKYTPATSISLRTRRPTTITLAITIIALLLLFLLPNPMNAVLRQQAELQNQLAKQISGIERVRQQAAQQAGIPAAEKKQIDQILRDLEARLRNAKTSTEAEQALSDAQAKLDQLQDPSATSRIQAQAAAGDALQNSSNANLRAAGQALSNNDSKGLAQALQNLAAQSSKLSDAQRKQLAQELEKAANQASQNASLSSALHQTAKSLADGSPSETSDAANAVSSAANQTAADQSTQNGINQASQGLQNAADNLASATDNTSGQQSGQQKGQGQGQSQGQSQGQNKGQGQGQGQGQSQGQGQGQGQGKGQGQGQGQGQGHGGNGGTTGGNSKQGKNEQVYVQGQSGQGSSVQSNDNTSGVVQPGSTVPYSQVIAQYNQMAHDAIDNSNVSPNEKDLVHNYFKSLEGQ